MASRYWVGGTAAWDATAGTKWALTTGGAGGQAVPTSADDVFFTAASGAGTITVSSVSANCNNLLCTGFTGTLACSTGIQIYGNCTLATTGIYSSLITSMKSAGKTLLTFGKSILWLSLTSPATVVVGDALTADTISLVSGTTLTLKSGLTHVVQSAFNTPTSGTSTLATDVSGTRATLTSPSASTFALNYIAVKDINFAGEAKWSPGTPFTNNGNNAGLTSLYSPHLAFGANF